MILACTVLIKLKYVTDGQAFRRWLIGCLHDRAKVEQTSSKHRTNIELAQAGSLEFGTPPRGSNVGLGLGS